MSNPDAFQLAAEVRKAHLKKSKPNVRREDIKVIERLCEICGKTHRMGIGPERCIRPIPAPFSGLCGE